MKIPQLPKRNPEGASSSGFQPPAFVSDLFKDMRDRRLIAPAVGLLVAIVAVPVVLSATPESTMPPAPLAPDPDAAAVEPGVLAVQEIGVRDYRERLEALERKDPFGDRFEESAATGAADASQLLAPEEAGQAAPSASSPDASGEASNMSGEAPTTSSGSVGGTPPPVSEAEEEPDVLVSRIDVEVGIVDRDRRQTIEGVKAGDLLPSKQTPVAMFLGINDNASEADLLVSRDVSRVNGEGECKPGRNNCEFLRMKDGDSAYLRFADGHRYVITVKDLYFERIPESKARGAE